MTSTPRTNEQMANDDETPPTAAQLEAWERADVFASADNNEP